MANYYIRPDGNDSNVGTGFTAGQAWRTLARVFQTGTPFTSGDTIWIAPGKYTAGASTTVTYTSPTYIKGDPTCSQFTDMNPGIVRFTAFTVNDNTSPTAMTFLSGSVMDYINISNIFVDLTNGTTDCITYSSANNWSIRNCVFIVGPSRQCLSISGAKNGLIDGCIALRGSQGFTITTTADTDTNMRIQNCKFAYQTDYGIYMSVLSSGGQRITNCIFEGIGSYAVRTAGNGNAANFARITNCIFAFCTGSLFCGLYSSEDYNRRIASGGNLTVPAGNNTVVNGAPQYDFGQFALFKIPLQNPFSVFYQSVNNGTGLQTYAPTTDMYGNTWSSGPLLPDIGCATAVQSAATSYYLPTERNQSLMQIGAGSISRSLYIYLGATGLTTLSIGLQAYYTKEDGIPVSIPLVAQTPSGAWVAGGFSEVSAINQPGIYRLDIPDAAISAGYNQTVVTVRGASGTNGAVVVIQEPPILGSQVRMGPFTVQADGVLTDERLKLFKGSIHSIDFKMVDQYGTGVDGTGTVVTANAYNSAGFLVDSYPCIAKYAEDGRYSFAIDATVTNVVGMYTINISRQIGSEINVFGRMKLEVLSP
jgi:hypothetical protein